MKPEDFIRMVEQYYGEYDRPLIRATVFKYLQGLPAGILQHLYKQLLLMYSNQYKAVPDVAMLEKVRAELNKYDSGVYRNGKRIGYYDGGRFIPDLSLLTKHQLEEYAQNYVYYEYPQGYLQLIGENQITDEERKLIGSNTAATPV